MRQSLGVAIAAVAALCPFLGHAGDWRLTPRFAVDQTATDNVTQSDVDKSGDFITNVTPGLSLRGEGARITSSIDYNFRRSFFAANPQFDQGNHQLQGSSEIELIRNHLTVSTNSTRSQQLTDTTGRVSRNRNSRNGNRSDVNRFQVSPTLRHRLGDWVSMEFRYSYDKATFTEDAFENSGGAVNSDFGDQNDSTENDFRVSASSGSKFSRTPMSLSATSRSLDRGDGRTESFKRINGTISYIFNRKFSANFNAGSELNDFQSTRSRNDGFSWSAGGTWTPSTRTSFSGSWGQRFFGSNFNVSASHRHRRWNFTLNYDESLSTGNDIQRGVQLVPLEDSLGNPIFDPITSSFIDIPLDTPSIRNEVSVSKNLRFRTSYQLRRSNVSVSYSEQQQNFQTSATQETVRVLDFAYSRSISGRLSLGFNSTWRQGQNRNSSGGDLFNVSSSLNYSIGPHTSGRVTYTFADQGESTTGRSGYTEHSLLAGLVFHF